MSERNSNSDVVRKPVRSYPIPENIYELDEPHPRVNRARYERVEKYRQPFDPSVNPFIIPPSISPSDLLKKL